MTEKSKKLFLPLLPAIEVNWIYEPDIAEEAFDTVAKIAFLAYLQDYRADPLTVEELQAIWMESCEMDDKLKDGEDSHSLWTFGEHHAANATLDGFDNLQECMLTITIKAE